MCVCVCVTLQSHHTETMLRCGLPSEKDEGRKVSSDFVWLFSGKHAATVQYGCMWYYNYAMYILQCVIILHKTTACGFSSNEGGCCWVKKTGESGRRLKRSSARLHHADAPTYVNSYEVSEVEDTQSSLASHRRPSCLSSAVRVHILLYCIYGELHVCQDINYTCSLCCYATKKNSKILFFLCSKENRAVNVCTHECELIITTYIHWVLLCYYTHRSCAGSVVYRKE